jgi:hypothetical protein
MQVAPDGTLVGQARNGNQHAFETLVTGMLSALHKRTNGYEKNEKAYEWKEEVNYDLLSCRMEKQPIISLALALNQFDLA